MLTAYYLRGMFWWIVLYNGMVNYGGTEIRNLYIIVSEFVIQGAFN